MKNLAAAIQMEVIYQYLRAVGFIKLDKTREDFSWEWFITDNGRIENMADLTQILGSESCIAVFQLMQAANVAEELKAAKH